MTVHLVPVGLSILLNLREGRGAPTGQPQVRQQVRGTLDQLKANWHERDARARELLANRDWAKRLQLRGWLPQVSAEAQSLHEAGCLPNDIVLLVATDTDEGILSAVVNGGRFPPPAPAYCASPSELTQDAFSPKAITIVRTPDMDLANPRRFVAAMRQLGALGRQLTGHVTDHEEVVLHLSGGYKAAIPFFLALAEGLRTVRSGATNVRACVLHESSGAESLVWVPLRWFPRRDEVLRDLQVVRDTGISQTNLLTGYAYEPEGGRSKLTSFGHGLLVLLDPGEPPVDPLAP